ncbi:Protein trichome birefringence-like [Quillaja saponaria]|uniref:Protein trichome birefringence-like n=1 Tax=Quillaja saponaria TaxID=32244 RepID=A0AAD7LNN4_QUISA|nr:Protein trichome birefringence-like [Quillaja saponaria]
MKVLNLKGKLPLPSIIALACALVFIAVLYAERVSFLSSSSIFKLKSCPRREAKSKSNDGKAAKHLDDPSIDDRFDFDPEECNVANGKWVFNRSIKPLYSDRTCPYLDIQVSCIKNGRPDSDYQHWEWQPEDCNLPRFNPELALKRLQGKRLLFVGDSLQRGQWKSFVCMVEWIIPEDQKSMRMEDSHSVFKAKEYNATIEFYWAPYLVESNT